ncbi:type II secretion system F family protein [Nocardioides dilutus]
MNGSAVVAVCLGLAAAITMPPAPPRWAPAQGGRDVEAPAGEGWMRRWRPLWALLAGGAAATFLSGSLAWPGGLVATLAVWVVIGRAEPPSVRRARERARRDLPHLVGLLADALRAGQSPTDALALVTRALPGPASDRLAPVVPRLRLGVEPQTVWASLAADPALAPLGRVLSRAEATGAPIVGAVARLAEALAEDVRGEVEDRARAVGVKAALPLGLCLLPAFVLLGIVPVAAGMLDTLGL